MTERPKRSGPTGGRDTDAQHDWKNTGKAPWLAKTLQDVVSPHPEYFQERDLDEHIRPGGETDEENEGTHQHRIITFFWSKAQALLEADQAMDEQMNPRNRTKGEEN